MRSVVSIFIVFLSCGCHSQNISTNEKILNASFSDVKSPTQKIISKPARKNPVKFIGTGLLFIYQKIFSEQIQASCIYKTSCSEFTRQSIHKHGFLIGTLAGFSQLTECFNGAIYEHAPIFIDTKKINNDIEGE